MQLDYTIRYVDGHSDGTRRAEERPHSHGGFEVSLSLSDSVFYFIGQAVVPLHPGVMLFVDDALLFKIVIEGDSYRRFLLNFTNETLRQISSPQSDFVSLFKNFKGYIQLDENHFLEACELFNNCLNSEAKNFGGDLNKDIAFLQLMVFLSEHIVKYSPFTPPIMVSQSRIAPIIEYILSHLNESISLDDLCGRFFISKSYLCCLFKRSTGFSVSDYIIRHRILKACSFLRDGFSVQEASEMCGFENYSHFIRTFNSIQGISPGKYARIRRRIPT